MYIFRKGQLKELYSPPVGSNGEQNGQITIIGGSSLFHGAPILAVKTASRIVDMVFFASPEPSLASVVKQMKASLSSFIWVPWGEVDAYIEKSDAVLIGPGMMRYSKENQKSKVKSPRILNIRGKQNDDSKFKSYDMEGSKTRIITERLLKRFPNKKWVIDAGSLQTMDVNWIPRSSILTPNKKELEILFKIKTPPGLETFKGRRRNLKVKTETQNPKLIQEKARQYNCIVVAKGVETVVASPYDLAIVKGGNPGLTKGGSGDVLAGLTVALLAKNDPFLSACAASYVEKFAADKLYKKVGTNYNMDDLAEKIPFNFKNLLYKQRSRKPRLNRG